MSSSDIAFSPAVKRIQTERGSRAAYARSDFETDVTDDLRAFLAEVDSGFLATASAEGQPYVQHRGGARGFVRALDEKTLGFLEWTGNRQFVTAGNLTENDRICLILLDYAHRRRVKIWGTARLVPVTEALLAKLASPSGRARPDGAILITVTAWSVNCPQHIPQKVDAVEAQAVIVKLQARITELEEENRRLKS